MDYFKNWYEQYKKKADAKAKENEDVSAYFVMEDKIKKKLNYNDNTDRFISLYNVKLEDITKMLTDLEKFVRENNNANLNHDLTRLYNKLITKLKEAALHQSKLDSSNIIRQDNSENTTFVIEIFKKMETI